MHCRILLLAGLSISMLGCGGSTPITTPGNENCTNHIDDNGDGKVDCADAKCSEHAACVKPEVCDNSIDDNGDGKVDCADSECAGQGCGPNCVCLGGVKVVPDAGSAGGGLGSGGGVGTGGGTGMGGGGGAGTGGGVGSGGGTATGGGVGSGGGTATGGGVGSGGGTGTGGGTPTGGGTGGGSSWTYSWDVGGWSSCSNTCGSGTQSRTVACVRSDAVLVADSACTTAKPSTSQTCSSTTGCNVCTLPWGGTIASGASVTAYLDDSPTGACTSQSRSCTNGVLSGTYTYRTCEAGCALPWGGNVMSGTSVKAYSIRFATSTWFCEAPKMSEFRTCTNGTLSGTFTWQNCTNYPCSDNGASFTDQAVLFPSSTRTVGASTLSCYGPTKTFKSAIYTGPDSGACQWGSWWHEQGACGFTGGKAYRCWGGVWGEVAAGAINGCPQQLP